MSDEVAALGWSFRVAFGGQSQPRDLVAQVHIAADASPEEINALLDKVARAQDRQILYYEIQDKRARLSGLLDIIKRAERQTTTIIEVARERWNQSGRRGEWGDDKLSGQEKNERMKFEKSMEDARLNARELQREITELEARYGTRAAHVGTDRGSGGSDRQGAGDDIPSGAAA